MPLELARDFALIGPSAHYGYDVLFRGGRLDRCANCADLLLHLLPLPQSLAWYLMQRELHCVIWSIGRLNSPSPARRHRRSPMNRVVTGFDTAGGPVIVHRGDPPTVIHAGRYVTTELWVTDRTPPAATASDPSTCAWELEPPQGGSCFRIVEIAPAGDATGESASVGAGSGAGHEGFQNAHATQTLDYVTVISGHVVLVVGNEEVTLSPGDSVVQQPGVPHDWQNRSTERAVMVGVLLSAR
jgi:mannose-6-phosphate isomerase-like protein (cupin superfamily)